MKIINDPVLGLLDVDKFLVRDVMQHPLFQRLSRIKQLGLTYYVYPGAVHTRFQHSLGAAYLMNLAIKTLRNKSVEITDQEYKSALFAILLHDLGHGPFSHTLEGEFFSEVSHEEISLEYMKIISNSLGNQFEEGIEVFKGTHPKKILHQLVSSQLDTDRLDYLNRDSFFTGVSEGIIGSQRIIKMLDVVGDQIVVEHKGIYSVEKFLIARRLMYWQVYLHKTVIAVDQMLKAAIRRARLLINNGEKTNTPWAFEYFLKNKITFDKLYQEIDGKNPLDVFAYVDDTEVIYALKQWRFSNDFVLRELSTRLLDRNLFKIEIFEDGIPENKLENIKDYVVSKHKIPKEYIDYFVSSGALYNKAYDTNKNHNIKILYKDGSLKDIAQASDIGGVQALSKVVKKEFVVYLR